MMRTAQAGIAAVLLLASATKAGEQTLAVLPTAFGPEVDHAVERLRKATAPFHSVEQAQAAGYQQETGCVERQPEGAMGYHFTNAALRDGLVELDKPEVLVYGKRADGSFKLNGIEYVVPVDSWKQDAPPTVMGQPMKRFDRAGIWYLHVWIWEPSPSGLFADWNPRVTCPQAPG